MKNNIQLLWNPFVRIAGWQAFIIGGIIAIITAIVGVYGNILYDGVLDAHSPEMDSSISMALVFTLINVLSVVLVFCLLALALTRNFRFVDVLGTMTLARYPFILLSLTALFVKFPAVDEILQNPLIVFSNSMFLFFTILSIPVIAWVIALMYNAYKESVGVKGSRLTVVFILALILAEIISKICVYYVIK